MSEYSVCFINGQLGNCNENCEDFLNGLCDIGDEIINNMPTELIIYLYEELEDPFYAAYKAIISPDLDKRKFVKQELGYE